MVRRPNHAVRNQAPALPMKARHELIRLSSNARVLGIPASKWAVSHPCLKMPPGSYSRSKKKVAWLAIRFPAKFCDAYIKQVMIVRLKSVPLTRSRRVGAPPKLASISTVRSIIASVSSTFSVDLRPSRSTERRASSLRPRRISHHGDSGAKKMRTKSGV